MTFTINQAALLSALNITGKCINSSVIIPILSNYLFDIDGKELKITGASMDISLTTSVQIAGNKTKAKFAVPAQKLANLLRSLPNTEISFTVENGSMTIKAGKGKYTIPTEDGEHFPVMKNDGDIKTSIESNSLLSCVNKTLFTCTLNGEEPYGGLSFSFADGCVKFTGTNRHVMGMYTGVSTLDHSKSFVVPVKTLQILQSIQLPDSIGLEIGDNNIIFQINENTVLRSILADFKYPDCEAIIPVTHTATATVNRNSFIGAIKRVSQFANGVTNMIAINATYGGLSLNAEDKDFSQDASEDIDCEYQGEELRIGVNSQLLLTALSKLESENVYVYLSTPMKPIILKEVAVEELDKKDLILVSPMFLGEDAA